MTLEKDLSLFEAKSEELNPYENYFLRENPFPGYGETGFDVCTDQDAIKKMFVSLLQTFNSEAKRMRINGKNGAGKTNILQYFERLTDEARRSKLIKNLQPIYVCAPGEGYFDVHGQIVDKLTGLFLSDLVKTLQSDSNLINTLMTEIMPASELLMVIRCIIKPDQPAFLSQEERQKDIFIRWMKGQKLSAADKKLLTHAGMPPADIASPSLAIRFLYGWLEVLKKLDLCDGIVLLFDEFEEIFEGLSRSRQSRYAQDLRHFFDTLKESVFFVIATVPEPRDLSQYPAIERRLGDPAELQAIGSLELATDYVMDYLNSGRDKYEAYQKAHLKQDNLRRPNGLEPLKREIVEKEYCSLEKAANAAQLDVLPGYFLPKMRERIKQIVEDNR